VQYIEHFYGAIITGANLFKDAHLFWPPKLYDGTLVASKQWTGMALCA